MEWWERYWETFRLLMTLRWTDFSVCVSNTKKKISEMHWNHSENQSRRNSFFWRHFSILMTHRKSPPFHRFFAYFTRNLVSFPRNFSFRFIHYRDVSSCRFQDLIGLFSWSLACASRSMQHEISLMLDWAERKINRCALKTLVCGQTMFNVCLHKHVSLILSALSGLRNAICCCRMHFLPYLTFRSAINIIVEYRSEDAKRRPNTFFH
jgi:hypothetical protein